jgi:hypothetical protein
VEAHKDELKDYDSRWARRGIAVLADVRAWSGARETVRAIALSGGRKEN